MPDFFRRLFGTGALVLRAPRAVLFAAARVPLDLERLFAAVPEPLFERAAVLLARAELERLEAALVERLAADLVERPVAAFVPPRPLLRAAVLPELVLRATDLAEVDFADRDLAELDLAELALPAPELRAVDLRAVEPRLEPDAAFAPEARVVRFGMLFVPADFVAPRALLLAAARFVPVEREVAVLVPLLLLAALFLLDALLRAVAVLRAVLFFSSLPL